ncbi:hypothetical protein AM500_19960 [Bacillus sp. FJAT-18017]|uniref:hypothetical protein n=1 Tax=Bacillus sp. FJAT-18017 TaxID=1705566 RepID=UPI0006AFC559|nr:hypothetical protein [Bacillus sp. FJAT-18017]ALC91806.1 hypothetical protein AM500_19960 [Bacillus sp. FJAT-18017]
MRKIAVAIVLYSLFILAFPLTGYACKCAYPPTVQQELQTSKAVFTGKVIGVKDHEKQYGKKILFAVIKSWKGLNESQVILDTGQGGGDCGFTFHEGTEYLVYASENVGRIYGDGSSMVTTICDRTKEAASAGEDFKLLGEPTVPEKKIDLSKNFKDGRNSFSTAALSLSVLGLGFLGAFLAWKINKTKRTE